MTIDAYLRHGGVEKILLCELISPAYPGYPHTPWPTVYLSDAPYITEPTDTPANQPFAPIIAEGGCPRLTRRIQEVAGGKSIPSYGQLILAHHDAHGVDLRTLAVMGAEVRLSITGPRHLVPYADRTRILTGRVVGRSGEVDGKVVLSIGDLKSSFDTIVIPPNKYDLASMPTIPEELDRQSIPYCLGKCLNISPVLIDIATCTYQVHDGPIQSVDAVFDNGVLLPTDHYTVDPATGTFAFAADHAPVGVVTANVRGAKEGDTHHATLQAVIDWLARTLGGLTGGEISISDLPTDPIGIYLAAETTVGAVLTALTRSVIGWWGFSRNGTLLVRPWSPPESTGVITIDEGGQLGTVEWEDVSTVIWRQPYIWNRNWTQIDNPASSVSDFWRGWLSKDGTRSEKYDIADLPLVYRGASAIVGDPLHTYFATDPEPGLPPLQSPQEVASRALDLFGTYRRIGCQRRIVRLSTTQNDPPLELGETVTLASCDHLDGNYRILGITDTWNGAVGMVDLTLFG